MAPPAARQLAALPRNRLERIDEEILELAENPRPHGAKRLERNLWRIRVGNHRVVYSVHDGDRTVLVVAIADRKEVYRLLRRMRLL